MELIPIFSLIVLVATLGTFVLAIGAYVMFRIRESRGRAGEPRVAPTYEADVMSPEPVETVHPTAPPTGTPRRTFTPDEKLVQYTSDGYVPLKDKPAEERRRWR